MTAVKAATRFFVVHHAFLATEGDFSHEKNISAKCTETQTHARIPRTDEHARWSHCDQKPSCKRARTIERLTKPALLADKVAGDFPRDARLTSPRDYQPVFQQPSCRSSDKYLTVLARENNLNCARLGLVMSRKHVPTAVARNRIKRVSREAFRVLKEQLRGWDIVVIGRFGVGNKTKLELRTALAWHWKKIERCKKS